MSTNSSGLTVVELVITIMLTSVILIFVFVLFDGFYKSNVRVAEYSIQNADLKIALHKIQSDLSKNNGLLAAVTVSSPILGPDGSSTEWKWNNHTIISRIPVTTGGATSLDRELVMDKTTSDECSGAAPTFLTAKYIYFIENNNLYRRIILPNIADACGTIASFDQKQTCRLQDISSHPDICQSADALLLNNVSRFEVLYYTTENSATPIEINEDNSQTSIENAKSATIFLETTKRINGENNTQKSTIRINIARKNS